MAPVLKKGLTLAEVLLSLGLCVVLILSCIALALSALRANTKSSDFVVAQAYAGQVLDNFLYSVPSSTDSFWSQASYPSPYQQESSQIANKDFQARLDVRRLATSQGLLRCSVRVVWQEGQAEGQHEVEVARLLYAH